MSENRQDPPWRWLGTPLLAAVLVLAIIGDGYFLHASQPARPAETTHPAPAMAAATFAPQAAVAAASLTPTVFAAPTASFAAAATPIPTPTPFITQEAPASTEASGPYAASARDAAPVPSHPLRVQTAIAAGKALCNVAADENSQSIYVTDDGSEQLLVFDVATRRQTASFDLEESLCSLALDEARHTVYIPTWRRKTGGGFESSQFQALNVSTGAISRYPAAYFPTGPFFDPANRILYAANTSTPNLVAVNTMSGVVTDSIDVPAKINRVALAPANGYLYAASPESNKLFVLDGKSRQVVATLDVGTRPWDVAADPRTGRIFVSSELSGTVTILDPQYDETLQVIKTGSHPRNLAIDSLHGVVYVLNAGDRTVSSFGTDGSALETSAPLSGAEDLTGLAVASQAREVFVVSKQHIYVLD